MLSNEIALAAELKKKINQMLVRQTNTFKQFNLK